MSLNPEIEKILNSANESSPKEEQKEKTLPSEEPEVDLSEPARGDAEDITETTQKKKKINSKFIAVTAAVTAAVLIFCAVFISQGMSVKRYENKYKISYPEGIPHEFCDAYGKNPTLAGSISFSDNKSKTLVYSKPDKDSALLEKGSNFQLRQNYRAIAITKDMADIEAMYGSADAFTSSSQSFTVKTVNGEKQKYQVIAAYIVNTDPNDDNGYAFPYNCYGNFTKKSYRHYSDTIKCRSLYTTGYLIKDSDCCLTVSVPSDIMPNFRFAIVGVKTDKVRKIKNVKENKRIRYPQAYCDKLGIHNIYNFAYKWYPEIVLNDKGETKQLTAKDFE